MSSPLHAVPSVPSAPDADISLPVPVLDEFLASLRAGPNERLYSASATRAGRWLAPDHLRMLRQHLLKQRRVWEEFDAVAVFNTLRLLVPSNGRTTEAEKVVEQALQSPLTARRLAEAIDAFRDDLQHAIGRDPGYDETEAFLLAAFVTFLVTPNRTS